MLYLFLFLFFVKYLDNQTEYYGVINKLFDVIKSDFNYKI